ncbi:MAG: nucleoside hydrolase [Abditibacteriota bacterium]|nr:nucleoside hydrolase [Abditibacteriota bacterium]
MKKIPVILDMDPGADDALAILLAVKSQAFDIKGITICGGNVSSDQCARNAAKVLNFLKVDIPIYKGSYRPLTASPKISDYVHGTDGLGNISSKWTYNEDLIKKISATDFILETLDKNPNLKIIATGPLTNIAKCISKNRPLMSKLKHLYWMGGAYTCAGNVTPVGEFNAICDPQAAKEVFNSYIPMTVVGLDVTMKLMLPKDTVDTLAKEGNETAKFCREILKAYFSYYTTYTSKPECCLHDPLAVLVCLYPNIISYSKIYKVDVSLEGITEGQTIIDRRPSYKWHNKDFLKYYEKEKDNFKKYGINEKMPTTNIVLDLDFKKALEKFISIVFK